jgi:N utilization substance protein B
VAGARRQGRAYALQILYARDGDGGADVASALASWDGDFQLELEPAAREFAQALITAAVERDAAIDELIVAASKNWRLERMSRVDRNILRLGTVELSAFPDVPIKVVINEAVELAKRFGTAESPAFVNGILDRIAGTLGRSPES